LQNSVRRTANKPAFLADAAGLPTVPAAAHDLRLAKSFNGRAIIDPIR